MYSDGYTTCSIHINDGTKGCRACTVATALCFDVMGSASKQAHYPFAKADLRNHLRMLGNRVRFIKHEPSLGLRWPRITTFITLTNFEIFSIYQQL